MNTWTVTTFPKYSTRGTTECIFAKNERGTKESKTSQQISVPDMHLTAVLTKEKTGPFECASVNFQLPDALVNKALTPTLEIRLFSSQ